MIEIETRQLAGIPVLHAVPAGKRECSLPCIIFITGLHLQVWFTVILPLRWLRPGFRVVMPDAPEHGARFKGNARSECSASGIYCSKTCRSLRRYVRRWWQKIGFQMSGLPSVGHRWGMTALGIMARHPEVKCVASLMGSGYFTRLAQTLFPPLQVQTPEQQAEFDAVIAPLAEWDVTHQLPRLADRPLLLWHGQDDDVVPAVETFRLQQALIQAGLDNNLTCLWEAGVRHRITPEALAATVTFFRQHL